VFSCHPPFIGTHGSADGLDGTHQTRTMVVEDKTFQLNGERMQIGSISQCGTAIRLFASGGKDKHVVFSNQLADRSVSFGSLQPGTMVVVTGTFKGVLEGKYCPQYKATSPIKIELYTPPSSDSSSSSSSSNSSGGRVSSSGVGSNMVPPSPAASPAAKPAGPEAANTLWDPSIKLTNEEQEMAKGVHSALEAFIPTHERDPDVHVDEWVTIRRAYVKVDDKTNDMIGKALSEWKAQEEDSDVGIMGKESEETDSGHYRFLTAFIIANIKGAENPNNTLVHDVPAKVFSVDCEGRVVLKIDATQETLVIGLQGPSFSVGAEVTVLSDSGEKNGCKKRGADADETELDPKKTSFGFKRQKIG